MRSKSQSGQLGFTLIEVLMSSALLVFMIGLATVPMFQFQKSENMVQLQGNIDLDHDIAMQKARNLKWLKGQMGLDPAPDASGAPYNKALADCFASKGTGCASQTFNLGDNPTTSSNATNKLKSISTITVDTNCASTKCSSVKVSILTSPSTMTAAQLKNYTGGVPPRSRALIFTMQASNFVSRSQIDFSACASSNFLTGISFQSLTGECAGITSVTDCNTQSSAPMKWFGQSSAAECQPIISKTCTNGFIQSGNFSTDPICYTPPATWMTGPAFSSFSPNSCAATGPGSPCDFSSATPHCTLTYSPTSIAQLWVANAASCGYSCINGYSGPACGTPPVPNSCNPVASATSPCVSTGATPQCAISSNPTTPFQSWAEYGSASPFLGTGCELKCLNGYTTSPIVGSPFCAVPPPGAPPVLSCSYESLITPGLWITGNPLSVPYGARFSCKVGFTNFTASSDWKYCSVLSSTLWASQCPVNGIGGSWAGPGTKWSSSGTDWDTLPVRADLNYFTTGGFPAFPAQRELWIGAFDMVAAQDAEPVNIIFQNPTCDSSGLIKCDVQEVCDEGDGVLKYTGSLKTNQLVPVLFNSSPNHINDTGTATSLNTSIDIGSDLIPAGTTYTLTNSSMSVPMACVEDTSANLVHWLTSGVAAASSKCTARHNLGACPANVPTCVGGTIISDTIKNGSCLNTPAYKTTPAPPAGVAATPVTPASTIGSYVACPATLTSNTWCQEGVIDEANYCGAGTGSIYNAYYCSPVVPVDACSMFLGIAGAPNPIAAAGTRTFTTTFTVAGSYYIPLQYYGGYDSGAPLNKHCTPATASISKGATVLSSINGPSATAGAGTGTGQCLDPAAAGKSGNVIDNDPNLQLTFSAAAGDVLTLKLTYDTLTGVGSGPPDSVWSSMYLGCESPPTTSPSCVYIPDASSPNLCKDLAGVAADTKRVSSTIGYGTCTAAEGAANKKVHVYPEGGLPDAGNNFEECIPSGHSIYDGTAGESLTCKCAVGNTVSTQALCGDAAGVGIAAAPTTNLCAAGSNPSAVTNGTPTTWDWTCSVSSPTAFTRPCSAPVSP